MRLKDVLNAIVKVADHPIQYSVEEYGVVFSANDDAIAARTPSAPQAAAPSWLQVRTFRVETNTFLAGLESAFGITVSDLSNTGAPAERSKKIQATLRQLLSQLGIDMNAANKSVFYNDLTGIVMVRATREDLDIVQAAIETLGGQPASVHPDGGSADASPPFYLNELMRRRYGLLPSRP